MPFSLSPRQLLAHWVPGFLLLAFVCVGYYFRPPPHLPAPIDHLGPAGIILLLAVFAFVAGLFLDSIRNLLVEEILCQRMIPKWGIEWNFILRFSDRDLTRIEEFYFLYYIADVNFALALLTAIPIWWAFGTLHLLSWKVWIFIVPTFAILVLDAGFLKGEMIDISKRKSQPANMMPHDGVYTRIRPSSIHGVGVFAILDIPKGTYIFPQDDDPLVEVEKGVVQQQSVEIQKLYNDFCIIRNGTQYLCPPNLNRMTISWYLNDSQNPNVGCDVDYRFFALRNILAGEELTADYSSYSESPPQTAS